MHNQLGTIARFRYIIPSIFPWGTVGIVVAEHRLHIRLFGLN
jgi:hypothetical protein